MVTLKNLVNKRNVNLFLLVIFTFNTIFIPYDTFELKMLSFFLLLLINIKDIFTIRENDEVFVFIFGFVLTSFNILASIFLTKGNLYANIQQGYAPYILLLYPIIKKSFISYEKIMITFLKWLSYLIVLTILLDLLNIIPLYSNSLMMWYHYSENAMIGKGVMFSLRYMIFIKTTPMLVISIPYLINNKKYLSSFATLIALVFSGTRANLLIGVVVFAFCVVCELYKRCSKEFFTKLLVIFGVIIFIIIFKYKLIHFVIQMFANKASNDSVRNTILNTIFASWAEKPISLFTGAGYTGMIYDLARCEYTYTVELSYWNLLRQIGLIPFLLVMIMYLFPIYYLIKSKANINYVVAYIGYLIIAYTNPLLYTSTGLVVLLFMYYICFIFYKNNTNIKSYSFIRIIINLNKTMLKKIGW